MVLSPLMSGYNNLNQRTFNNLYGGLNNVGGFLSSLTRKGQGSADLPFYDPRASIFKQIMSPAQQAQVYANNSLMSTIGGFQTANQQQSQLGAMTNARALELKSLYDKQINEQKKADFLANYAMRDASAYRDRANWMKAGATAKQRRVNRTSSNMGGFMSNLSSRY